MVSASPSTLNALVGDPRVGATMWAAALGRLHSCDPATVTAVLAGNATTTELPAAAAITLLKRCAVRDEPVELARRIVAGETRPEVLDVAALFAGTAALPHLEVEVAQLRRNVRERALACKGGSPGQAPSLRSAVAAELISAPVSRTAAALAALELLAAPTYPDLLIDDVIPCDDVPLSSSLVGRKGDVARLEWGAHLLDGLDTYTFASLSTLACDPHPGDLPLPDLGAPSPAVFVTTVLFLGTVDGTLFTGSVFGDPDRGLATGALSWLVERFPISARFNVGSGSASLSELVSRTARIACRCGTPVWPTPGNERLSVAELCGFTRLGVDGRPDTDDEHLEWLLAVALDADADTSQLLADVTRDATVTRELPLLCPSESAAVIARIVPASLATTDRSASAQWDRMFCTAVRALATTVDARNQAAQLAALLAVLEDRPEISDRVAAALAAPATIPVELPLPLVEFSIRRVGLRPWLETSPQVRVWFARATEHLGVDAAAAAAALVDNGFCGTPDELVELLHTVTP